MRRLPDSPWLRGALAILAGAAGVFCFAPFAAFWLAFPVWLGFFLLLREAPTTRGGFLLGFCFGSGFFLAGVSWVYVSLSVFGGLPPWLAGIATFLFCSVLALFPALAGAAFKRWQPGEAVAQALLFGALWMLAEWLRGWVFTGFPWLALGYSQAPPSPLAGFAPVVGVYGVSLIVATLAALLLRWRIGVPILVIALAAGFGLRQLAWTTPAGEPVSVALVQGNVPQELKFRPENFIPTLLLYRDLVADNPAQITVLPETAVPVLFEQLPPEFVAEMKRLAARQGGDLILGAASGGGGTYRNSAITLGNAPMQSYSKSHLVPFGEFIPPGFGWFLDLVHIPMADFTRGTVPQPPFVLGNQRVAANICYEDAFGEEIIRALPEATLLVNLSNTAWFGRSLAQPQHLQMARLRALETGRPMLRATNTGMTAVVTPQGAVQAVLPPFTRGVLKAEVRGYQGMTPYARLGNLPALLLAVGAGVLALALAHRKRRQK
ncbi:MAG: apolipoprotein N-acyltransferase [Betaproteobacteria bacterium]